MRVLLVSHRFPPDWITGVERYTEALARELVRAGDAVTVVAGRRGPPGAPHALAERSAGGAAVHRLVAEEQPPERFLAGHEDLERLLDAIVGEAEPDVVHVNHVLYLSPRICEIARRRGAAILLSLHDYYFACPRVQLLRVSGERCAGPEGGRACASACFRGEPRAAARWRARADYFRRLLTVPDLVHVPSHYVGAVFAPLLPAPDRLRELPLGIPHPLAPAARERRRAGPLRVAFLGKPSPHKGLDVLFRALELAALDEVSLTVAGALRTEDAERLRARAAAIPGLSLRLAGGYEPAELPGLVGGADCAVVPSLWAEAYSLVAREALALGLPVLASSLGALPEAVRAGENGLVFDPARPDELAGLLRRLASDRRLLRRLRAGARATHVPTMAEHAISMRALYQAAIAARRARRPGAAREVRALEASFARLLDLGFAARDQPAAASSR